jgi:hypothetical protein
MATRLGAFEIARLGLDRNGTAAKECFGFRFNQCGAEAAHHRLCLWRRGGARFASDLAPHIKSGARLPHRPDLAPAAEDEGLIDFFAAHYVIRSPNCPGPGIGPAPVRPARLLKTGEAAQIKRQGTSRQR